MELATRTVADRAAAQHHALSELAAATSPGNVEAVLNLGAAVLMHALLEPAVLDPVLRLVDRSVRESLRDEHVALGDDLALLAEIHRGGDPGGDAEILASALHARLTAHVARDERTLYRPLGRLSQLPDPGSDRRQ
jgi:hypothetical protein